MANIVLDSKFLDSAIWQYPEARLLFITSLLMAAPMELFNPESSYEARSWSPTGFVVPPGFYGFIDAATVGLIGRSGLEMEAGFQALEYLMSSDRDSERRDYGGRRLVKIRSGFIVLNFEDYIYERTRKPMQPRREALIKMILERDRQRCGICGEAIANLKCSSTHIDHIEPFILGGSDDSVDNFQLAHHGCNIRKKDTLDSSKWRHHSMPKILVD